MRYALIVAGAVAKYPYNLAALCQDNPQVSFPREMTDERLAEWGLATVAEVLQPAASGIGKNVVEGAPALVNGAWTQTWTEVDASAGEIAARQVAAADDAAKVAAKADAFVASFIAMTPAQVLNYVSANVTDLASAKALLGKMALMMLLLARRGLR